MSEYYSSKPHAKKAPPEPDESIVTFVTDDLGLALIAEKGIELNFECPFCGDRKPDHFNLNSETGLWKCFKCGEKGSLVQLVPKLAELGVVDVSQLRKLTSQAKSVVSIGKVSRVRSLFSGSGRAKSKPKPSVTTLGTMVDICSASWTRKARRYALSRLSESTVEQFRLGVVPKDLPQRLADASIPEREGIESGVLRSTAKGTEPRWAGAIVIPYVVDGQVVTLEYRLLDDALTKKYGKYQALPGSRVLFNQDALASSKTIIVCEGAIDAMTAEQLGASAVGMPGNSSFKGEWAKGFAAAGVQQAVLCLDNGEAGTERGRLAAREALESVGIEVADLVLPSGVGDLNDYATKHAGDASSFKKLIDAALLSAATRAASSKRKKKSLKSVGAMKARAQIVVNDRPSRDIKADAAAAVLAANALELMLFRRDGEIVRIKTGHVPRIEPLSSPWFEKFLCDVADWIRRFKKTDVDVHPPASIIRMLMAEPDPRLPVLTAAVSVPFFDRTGTLVTEPGYNETECVYLVPPKGWTMPAVSRRPSKREVERARSLILDDLLVDFAFVGAADRAHAVAALILPFIRSMIEGPTPMHLCEAPGPGVGKSLLWAVISLVFLGDFVNATVLPRSDEETRKRITAQLSTAPPYVLFDNVDRDDRGHRVESASLAAVLSSTRWADRKLGVSEVIEALNRATWLMTGNNVQLSMELTRRLVLSRLDAKTDAPWLRKGFKHENLRAWSMEHRSDLVWAVLTLVQAWISAGQPLGKKTLGSFEDWAAKMGGILEVAGVEGFLGNLDELYESADSESNDWREFVRTWWAEFSDKAVSPTELTELCDRETLLSDDLGDRTDRGKATWVGGELARQRDRVYAGYRIVQAKDGGRKRGRAYKLVPVEEHDLEEHATKEGPVGKETRESVRPPKKGDPRGRSPSVKKARLTGAREAKDSKETASRD